MLKFSVVFAVLLASPCFADDTLPLLGNEGQEPILASDIISDPVVTGSTQKPDCTIFNCAIEVNRVENLIKTNSSP